MSEIDDSVPDLSRVSAPAKPARPPSEPREGARFLQLKIALGLVAAITLAFFLWPHGKAERKIADGYLMDESGAPVAVASRLAPVTLVHFWATWCPPCRLEIPGLLAFVDEIGRERLGLVLVAVADERERAVRFIANPRFPVLFDPVWDVALRFRTRQLPESHLVVDGKVVASFVGASDWRSAAVRRNVLARLEAHERAPAPAR